jgi:H+/Cl- antiporter ClcA
VAIDRPDNLNVREPLTLALSLAKWFCLAGVVGVLAGSGSAAFLVGLYWATETREQTPWLIYLLPLGGLLIGWFYSRFGRDFEAGNNLLIDRAQNGGGNVSWVMAPGIVFATIGTHLFGGSAGREGTAVQMGGSLADAVGRLFRLSPADRRLILMSGMSGGFGAVFGTPVAGAVFAMEVLAIGRIRYDAIFPCLIAAVVGDSVCRGLGIDHHIYEVDPLPEVTATMLLWALMAGLAFGGASRIFAELTHGISRLVAGRVRTPWIRPFYGGIAVVGLTYLVGTRDYLGLSLPLIDASFTAGGIVFWAFALKIVFTAVTLGTGFKGGEVTPLFCIGATLGHSFASLAGQPTDVFAALGFVAVFAGAANTPLTCVLMGIELFGAELAAPIAVACVISYVVSGHHGIYRSQQIDTPKCSALETADGITPRQLRTGMKADESPANAGTSENEPARASSGRGD